MVLGEGSAEAEALLTSPSERVASKLQDRICRGPASKHARTRRAHSLSDRLPRATASKSRAQWRGVRGRSLL